jgi:hypothetical protein
MATTKSTRSGGATVKAAAGLAPLAMALLLQHAVLPSTGGPPPEGSPDPVVCPAEIEGVQGCHDEYPSGCSPTAKYDGFLNLLKNQLPQPTAKPVRTLGQADFADLDKKTPKDLTATNHADFADTLKQLGEGQIHAVIAYLYYVKSSGQESSNCELSADDSVDFHIGLGFDADLAAKVLANGGRKLTPDDHQALTDNSIIVEMTPHYRLKFKPDWSIDMLKPALGRQVRVVGQLLIDNEHNNSKDNCALGNGPHCWRASTWELHPVTQFQVCTKDTCAENSPDWVDLENFEPPAKTVITK